MRIRVFVISLGIILTTAATRSCFGADDWSAYLPAAGYASLRAITPTLLEVAAVTAPASGEAPRSEPFRAEDFRVSYDGADAPARVVGWKRRVLYAPIKRRDLRVLTSVYLELVSPSPPSNSERLPEITVKPQSSALWPGAPVLRVSVDPSRLSPALHVNQEGYAPGLPKSAFVGFYLGSGGELEIDPSAGFDLIETTSGKSVFHGPLLARRDSGFPGVPRPYQHVLEADFSAFDTPGQYRLSVRNLGVSLPFRIDAGAILAAARGYALGLYHQRCGTANELPFTRFSHDACHTAPAAVPTPEAEFAAAWKIIAELEKDSVKPEHAEQQLRHARDQHFPFVRPGKIDVSGGHHDAGDYSKYTINSANLVHALMFAVDAFPSVAELDNLGLPESGDGISDVMQEAKWEADFLAKMQDDDGGFYFLVYPRDRRYENDVLPDHGDPQIVWPKTTASTAAAVGALAQCAGSPRFKQQYPEVAKRYLEQAKRGFAFLESAVARFGQAGAYQRLTHYGDAFQHDDELAWAACELFVATGDRAYEKRLFAWYPNPSDPSTWLYQWRHAAFAYGNALRSYAFAVRTKRLARNQVDVAYLTRCETELRRAGEAAARAADQSAYGVSLPEQSKRIGQVGWFFPSDEAFDITVAYQLQDWPKYRAAVLSNLNYELGANPIDRSYLTGLGQRPQREIVHQFAQADTRILPPSGIPLGSVQTAFTYLGVYKGELQPWSWPRDDGGESYAIYDRWSDAYNLNTEFVVVNQARSLASVAFWAAQSALKTQPWQAAPAKIVGATGTVPLDRPITLRLECASLDLGPARIVWEARDQEPIEASSFTFIPHHPGPQWIEAEASLPDGRRVFARTEVQADSPVVFWVNGALPAGATAYAQGGDTWDWIKPASKPPELAACATFPQHESALADGIHEHSFDQAEATLDVAPGDVLFAYIFIDPQHVPKTVMLEWNDGSNEHRAFWGENHIPYGRMGTDGQRPMGKLPPAGRWVRLEVPAKSVGLEGRTVKGMVFRLHSGRARWDAAGKMKRS